MNQVLFWHPVRITADSGINQTPGQLCEFTFLLAYPVLASNTDEFTKTIEI